MLVYKLKLSKEQKQELKVRLKQVQDFGEVSKVKQILVILARSEGGEISQIALTLAIAKETARTYFKKYLILGILSLARKSQSGQPGKLTKKQKVELGEIIENSPNKRDFLARVGEVQ